MPPSTMFINPPVAYPSAYSIQKFEQTDEHILIHFNEHEHEHEHEYEHAHEHEHAHKSILNIPKDGSILYNFSNNGQNMHIYITYEQMDKLIKHTQVV